MPSEALELVHRIYEGWSRGDYSWEAWADPEIEFEVADGPEAGVYHGLDEMREVWRAYLSAWRDLRSEPERFMESGDEILVITRFHGRGHESGVPLDFARRASHFIVRGGTVVRLVLWNDVEQALAGFGS